MTNHIVPGNSRTSNSDQAAVDPLAPIPLGEGFHPTAEEMQQHWRHHYGPGKYAMLRVREEDNLPAAPGHPGVALIRCQDTADPGELVFVCDQDNDTRFATAGALATGETIIGVVVQTLLRYDRQQPAAKPDEKKAVYHIVDGTLQARLDGGQV